MNDQGTGLGDTVEEVVEEHTDVEVVEEEIPCPDNCGCDRCIAEPEPKLLAMGKLPKVHTMEDMADKINGIIDFIS